MKKLLINPYWYPFNASGTFRWLNYSKYIDFDVLTSKSPRRGFRDETIEIVPKTRVYRFGNNLPAFIWGIFASIRVLFFRYDVYIFSSPPESLLFGAWLLEKMGKKVLVDMRDTIDRENQRLKWLVPFYRFFYKRLKNIVVCWHFMDKDKPVVHHGYDKICIIVKPPLCFNFSNKRIKRSKYLKLLEHGFIQDYTNKFVGYASSSYPTVRKLGYKVEHNMHPEVDNFKLISWEESARLMLEQIKGGGKG